MHATTPAKGFIREVLRAVLRPRTHLPRRLLNPTSINSPGIPKPAARMESTAAGEGRPAGPGSDLQVIRLQLMRTGGWDKCWEEGVTPWDLGQPTPVVQQLIQTGSFPKGRVLVPGCGTGYDVVALASPDRYVVGLEISDFALKKAKEKSLIDKLQSSCRVYLNALEEGSLNFLLADFFTWHPDELFDVIFDYSFFCAIDPCLRSAWAKKIGELLKPDGELITLILLISDQVEGAPYNTSVADYEDVLHPLGFNAISIEDNELAVQRRKGREKLGRWKRCLTQSSF